MQKNLTFSGKVNGTYFQLMGFDTLGKPIYYTTYNRDAAIGTGADQLHQLKIYNLEGENITLHEWDGGGVRTSHREFGGRATQKDDPTEGNRPCNPCRGYSHRCRYQCAG